MKTINVEPMNKDNGNRYKWFKGFLDNKNISFKFTYSKNMDEQVYIKINDSDFIRTTLSFFNDNVKPVRNIKGQFVPVTD